MVHVPSWDVQVIIGDYTTLCCYEACGAKHLGRPRPEAGRQWEEKKGQESLLIPCRLNPTSYWPPVCPQLSPAFVPTGDVSCVGNSSGCKERRVGGQVWESAGKMGRRQEECFLLWPECLSSVKSSQLKAKCFGSVCKVFPNVLVSLFAGTCAQMFSWRLLPVFKQSICYRLLYNKVEWEIEVVNFPSE